MKNQATILLVDDDAQFLRALHTALSSAGYTVAAAADPRAALGYVVEMKHRFDLIITDVQMLALDGLRLLQLLKENIPHVPIIVITAFGSAQTQAQSLAAGACDFLAKPFSKNEIISAVERALHSACKETQP